MWPRKVSFQPGVGRSIPSALLRAMPGRWRSRELAGAYVNGNGRCLNESSEPAGCNRPAAHASESGHASRCDDNSVPPRQSGEHIPIIRPARYSDVRPRVQLDVVRQLVDQAGVEGTLPLRVALRAHGAEEPDIAV